RCFTPYGVFSVDLSDATNSASRLCDCLDLLFGIDMATRSRGEDLLWSTFELAAEFRILANGLCPASHSMRAVLFLFLASSLRVSCRCCGSDDFSSRWLRRMGIASNVGRAAFSRLWVAGNSRDARIAAGDCSTSLAGYLFNNRTYGVGIFGTA